MFDILPTADIGNSKEMRFMANSGACLDIPTGKRKEGAYGESIILGGVGLTDGICGKAHNFKSTVLAFFVGVILYRYSMMRSNCSWFDTEVTTEFERVLGLLLATGFFEKYRDNPWGMIDDRIVTITDKASVPGDKHWRAICKFVEEVKVKDPKTWERELEIVDRFGKPFKFPIPTVSPYDSISEFDTSGIELIREKADVGDKGRNMLPTRQGLAKDQVIRQMNTIATRGNHFCLTTAQWGDEKLPMDAAPGTQVKRKINTIKVGEKIRGVPDAYLYLSSHLYQIDGSENIMDDQKGNAEFPLDFSSGTENVDLWRCPMNLFRSKTGLSKFKIDLIVSQKHGVQPTLTEFYHVFKKKKRWGVEGGGQYYTFSLYPDLKLQRTEIRSKINSDPLLRRAINITSEIAQIQDFVPGWSCKVPPMAELRKKLEADGYDWNVLLDTREWYTFKDFAKYHKPFLSSFDLLEMYYGNYTPYWLEKDKKTIRKEFRQVESAS